MSSSFTKPRAHRRALTIALLATAVGLGACTEVQVQQTRVMLDTSTSCGANNNNNGSGGFNNGGNQPPQMSTAVMDTYIVQVFELYDPENAGTNACDVCLADRQNLSGPQACFLERETCVCGDQTPVSPAALPGQLQNLHVSLTANYNTLYCVRILAVQRTSQAEEGQCQCDPGWESVARTRLCAVSKPYSASALPVPISVQCEDNKGFAACAAEAANSTASTN